MQTILYHKNAPNFQPLFYSSAFSNQSYDGQFDVFCLIFDAKHFSRNITGWKSLFEVFVCIGCFSTSIHPIRFILKDLLTPNSTEEYHLNIFQDYFELIVGQNIVDTSCVLSSKKVRIMKSPKVLVLATVLLVGTTLAAYLAFRQNAQNQRTYDKDEPTVIRNGDISDKQKKHSKRYNQGSKVRSLIMKVDRDLQMIIGEPYSSSEPDVTQEEYIHKLTCGADTIFAGRVLRKSSQLSEDKKSVFTDYEIEILDTIKNGTPLALEIGSVATVSRSGGAVKLNGFVVDVLDKSFKRLIVGDKYLLFVDYLSDTESFVSSDRDGVFEISSTVKRFTDSSPKYKYNARNAETEEFIRQIRTTSLSCF
jgi:hypothetical protein